MMLIARVVWVPYIEQFVSCLSNNYYFMTRCMAVCVGLIKNLRETVGTGEDRLLCIHFVAQAERLGESYWLNVQLYVM